MKRSAAMLLLLALAAFPSFAQMPAPAQESYDRGMQLYRSRDCKAAIEPLEIAVHASPRPSALLALGFCYRQLNQYANATDAYQRYLQTHSDDEKRALLLLEETMNEERAWRRTHPEEAEPVVPQKPRVQQPLPPAPEPAPAQSAPPAIAEDEPAQPHLLQAAPRAAEPANGASNPLPGPPIVVQEPPAEPQQQRPLIYSWVAGGAALVSVGVGVGLGVSSQSTANELTQSQHPGAQVAQMDSDVHNKAVAGNVLIGVGIGLAVLSAGLFIFHF